MKPVITVQLQPCQCWTRLEPDKADTQIRYTAPLSCPSCRRSVERLGMILRADNVQDEWTVIVPEDA